MIGNVVLLRKLSRHKLAKLAFMANFMIFLINNTQNACMRCKENLPNEYLLIR